MVVHEFCVSFRVCPNNLHTARKDPIKWWQEDGVDSYEASEMDISSVISSEGKSTTNSR